MLYNSRVTYRKGKHSISVLFNGHTTYTIQCFTTPIGSLSLSKRSTFKHRKHPLCYHREDRTHSFDSSSTAIGPWESSAPSLFVIRKVHLIRLPNRSYLQSIEVFSLKIKLRDWYILRYNRATRPDIEGSIRRNLVIAIVFDNHHRDAYWVGHKGNSLMC